MTLHETSSTVATALGRFDRLGIASPVIVQASPTTRSLGQNFVHVCIDDLSRIAFSQVTSNGKKESAIAFLHATIAYHQSLGITVTRVMTEHRKHALAPWLHNYNWHRPHVRLANTMPELAPVLTGRI